MKNEDFHQVNEKELMDFYNLNGNFGRLKLRFMFLKSWLLHTLSYSNPIPELVVKFQKDRGVNIGKNCHISPYVLFDLIYPNQITIEDNVTIGSNTMIYAHVNPTSSQFLKTHGYARKVESVLIKENTSVSSGCIITAGTIIGKNCIIGAGSVVSTTIPDNSVVLGNPARVIKKIEP
jgi:maltose O-acetyltransferase